MVSRAAFVTGRGALDLCGGSWATAPVAPAAGVVALSSNLEAATVSDPISNANMWDFVLGVGRQGATYGGTTNFAFTSVVSTTGPTGATTKVLNQHFPAVVSGSTSNYGAPPTGTGITLTSTPLAGGAVDEATIEFDFRAKSAGVPWGWGAKIPGLGGVKPGQGGVPTGGSPSVYGWSGRCMERRQGSDTANLQARLVGYFYAPWQQSGSIGVDLVTNKLLTANTWHHIRQYHRMNTVTTEGSTNPPADGIHRIWLDGVLCYESLTTVYRFYTDANITHLCWDNFYGGSDVADAPNTWGPTADTDHQFDNLVITTGGGSGGATPAADTTAPSVPTNVAASSVTDTSFVVTWNPSTDDTAVQRYSVQVNGAVVAQPTGTTTTVTGLTPSTSYAVRVQARDAAANYSALSPAVNVTTSATASNGFADTTPTGPTGTFTLAFSDDFAGTTLSAARWAPHWFTEGGVHNTSGTYAANVAVHDSAVWLALPDATHGGEINSNPNGGATTGYQFANDFYVEGRVWFPGDGTNLYNWASFWTTGQNWPMTGENDIAEILSGKMTSNYHYGTSSTTDVPQGSGSYSGYYGDAWHVFGVHRKSGTSDFYIDGVKRWTATTGDGGAPEFVVFNLQANSGSSNVNYDTTVAQVRMDWVKVWSVSGTVSAPVAAFTGTPVSGATPLAVQFASTSTGSPTSYAWTFGDGGTSTAASPSHTYTAAGTYTVALTVTNSAGSNTQTRTGYITSGAATGSIAQVGTATLYEIASGTSAVVPVPSGATSAHYLVATVVHSDTAAIALPSGWTSLASISSVGQPVSLAKFGRFHDGTSTSYTFATSATAGRVSGLMYALSGVDTTTPLDVASSTVQSSGTSAALVVPSITTATANAWLDTSFAVNAATAADGVVPSGFALVNRSSGTGRRGVVAQTVQATAGATGTVSWIETPTTTALPQAAALVALRPA